MKGLRQRKYLFVLLALLVVFAACKGESPTAPPPTTGAGGGTGGGSTTPPSGATIALTVSNATPLVSSTTVITATVTQNGNPVPNGTAVEFNATSPATFTDTTLGTTIRTTTNGVATATLTSSTAGTVQVTANVNNVTAKTTVTFGSQPTTPPPTNTAPTITAISPTSGQPTAGTLVTITGSNFKAPVRVIFDFGSGVTKEGFVSSVTPTQIQVIAPNVDLPTGTQSLPATITVINQAGTANEASVSASTPFNYTAAVLTPTVTTVSPDSGPIEGGTRITIFGSGFQNPVQVAFSTGGAPWAQMNVISINFNQIVAVTPAARDVNSNGSGTLTGPVNLRVLNINSNKDVTLTGAFRYTPKMQITTVGPNEGPFTGGTRFVIDGIGFDDPLAVTTAGVAAQVVRVSGSEVVAISSGVQPQGCADVTGPIIVTNTNNGDSAQGPIWIYRIPKPILLDVNNGVAAALGGTTTIKVKNAFGTPRFQIGGKTAQVTGSTFDPLTNVTTFTVIVPPTLQLQTQACGGVNGVNFPVTTAFDVIYTSAETQCTDTFTGGQLVSPPNAPAIAFSPTGGFTPFTAAFVAASAGPPATPASVTPSAPQTVAIVDNGTAPLQINSITQTGPNCSQFTISTPTAPITLNQCDIGIFTVQYNGPNPPAKGSGTCSIVIDTNAGVKTLPLFGTAQ